MSCVDRDDVDMFPDFLAAESVGEVAMEELESLSESRYGRLLTRLTQTRSFSSLELPPPYDPMRRDSRKLSASEGKPTRSTSVSCSVEPPTGEFSRLLSLSSSSGGGTLPFVIARRISSVTALPAFPAQKEKIENYILSK